MISLGSGSPVDLWTTEERCPQLHRRISKRRKLIHGLKKTVGAYRAPSPAVLSLLLRTDRKQADN